MNYYHGGDNREMVYPGLEALGRHYLVQEISNKYGPVGNARQYTVASTMQNDLYQAYISALENRTDQSIAKVREVITANKAQKDRITLYIKNYENNNGLSSRIHNYKSSEEPQFKVSGPMGRPMQIDRTGLNIVFAAGTGVLPFMDLVGFLARQTINLNMTEFDEGEEVKSPFKLVVCASFAQDD